MPELLITADEVKNLTNAKLGIEPHKFTVHIPEVQQRWLRPKLGGALFEQLLAYVAPVVAPGDAAPAPTAIGTLAAEVKPMLAAWTIVKAWPDLLIQLSNVGVTVQTGGTNGTTSADAKLVAMTLEAYKETAEWRTAELLRWLADNRADYPTYAPASSVSVPTRPLGGIYF